MGLFVPQHITDLATKMHLLQKTGELCDLTLTSSSGNEVKVHRLVLKCCCSEIVMNQITRDVVNFSDVSTEILESAVHFMYTGEIQLDRASVLDTVSAYRELGLKSALEKLTGISPSIDSTGIGPSVHPNVQQMAQTHTNVSPSGTFYFVKEISVKF